MYKKKQHIGAHKTPFNKQRKQGVDHHAPQDTRYTPTPVPERPASRTSRSRLDSETRIWILQDKDPGLERHSPDSALTASSNGSNLSVQRGPSNTPKFSRSQSIPNLFELPPFPLEQSRKISDSPGTHRTNSLSKSGPHWNQGPVSNVHQGQFVRVKVGPYDDNDSGRGGIESSSLHRNRFKSESNLFDPEVNEPVRRIEKRQPFSVRTIEMKKMLGMFGFVLSCKYVLHDPFVPRELRSFPRIDTVSIEGVAHRSGIRQGHFVLEINGQSLELSSLNRCTSLLQMGGDHLKLKIASNHQTNEPVDTQDRTKGTTWSNFSRDIPSSDAPRHRVRYRESALQKRLMASHPTHKMKRANSTPNLAEDDQAHIYEELGEPLPHVETPAPKPQTETGRRGSDASKSGRRPAPQKPSGKPDTTHKQPPRRPDNPQKNAGRSIVDGEASSRKNSVDLVNGSGGFPPSPPPRPVPDWGAVITAKSPGERGSNPTVMKMGGKRNDKVGRDAKSAVVEMKISPGIGIASIASVTCSTSTSSTSETPMKFSSFTGPFKDDVSNIAATPPSRLPYDPGRVQEESGSRGLSTPHSQINIVAMQAAENGRGRATPMPQHPGNNTSRNVAMEDSGYKEMSASRNNIFGAVITESGGALQSSGNKGLSIDMDGPANKGTPASKASVGQGEKSEFRSPQNVLEGQRTAQTRMEDPLNLLEAIRQHPLMRNDRSTSNEQNSTVASPFHATIPRHGPQKVPPPIPPPPKPKTHKNAISEGAVNCGPTFERSTSLTQELATHAIPPDTEIKNLRLLKPVNQDISTPSELRVQAERGESNQRIQTTARRQAPAPPTFKTHQQKVDIAALMKQATKSNARQNLKSKYITPPDFRNPRQNLRPESHLTQVFHLDGATVDQSYSEDNLADQEDRESVPIFRFDVSPGMLLLSGATVDQSSTENDLLPIVPPPPMMDFTCSEPNLTEIPSQDNPVYSWNRRLESSNCTLPPFTDRNISVGNDSVFFEGIASPPPPVFFVDPHENSGRESRHESRSHLLAILASRAPRLHLKAAPDLHSKTAPDLHSKTAPDLRPKATPNLHSKTAPLLHSETAPDLHSKTAPYLQSKTAPDLHSKATPNLHSKTAPDIHSKTAPDLHFKTAPDLHSKAAPDLHPIIDQETIPRRFAPGINPLQVSDPTSAPLPPPQFQSVPDVGPKLHRPPPEPPSKHQLGTPNGAPRRQVPSEDCVSDWSYSDVAEWLRQIGLGEHVAAFTSQRVDGRRLMAMTRRELIELGVNEMTQRRDIERGLLRFKSLANT